MKGSETWDDGVRIPHFGAPHKGSPSFLSLYSLRLSGLIYECKLGPGNGIFRRDGLSFSIFHDLKQVAKCGTLLVSIAGYFSPSGQRGNKSTINGRLSATPLIFRAACFCVSWTSAGAKNGRRMEIYSLGRQIYILSSSSRGVDCGGQIKDSRKQTGV